MPKGVRISEIVKDDIRRDYYERCMTVDAIAEKYNVHRRRIYDYVKADRYTSYAIKHKRKMTYLSKDDVELILLLIMECDSILKDKNKIIAKCLEDRMLQMADDMTQL